MREFENAVESLCVHSIQESLQEVTYPERDHPEQPEFEAAMSKHMKIQREEPAYASSYDVPYFNGSGQRGVDSIVGPKGERGFAFAISKFEVIKHLTQKTDSGLGTFKYDVDMIEPTLDKILRDLDMTVRIDHDRGMGVLVWNVWI